MPTGPEMLETLKGAPPQERELWLDIPEKLDLCKLTSSDLVAAGCTPAQAQTIANALNQQDVRPLTDVIGRQLRVKFRVFATRVDNLCRLRCERQENAEWMKAYLALRFPDSTIAGPVPIEDTPLFRIDLHFDNNATPYAVREELLRCPAALLVKLYEVRIAEQPHFRVDSSNLAAWLDSQEEEPWWTVDGDPLLMSRLEFPAPPDELAAQIRDIDKPLLIADPSGQGAGEEISSERIVRVAEMDDWGNRIFRLVWEGGTTDWQMVEDEPTSGR